MKVILSFLSSLFFLYSAFAINDKACDYAASNIEFIHTQTVLAIKAKEVKTSRYYAYKALNAIEKSKIQLTECGCGDVSSQMNESLENLKKATRVVSLNGTRILLERALENILGGLNALEEHTEHSHSIYGNEMLAINTKSALVEKPVKSQLTSESLEKKIDLSLAQYQKSLEKVVREVECKEAYEFAKNIYLYSEKELLKTGQSEARKYYHLRTKEITSDALEELSLCMKTVI